VIRAGQGRWLPAEVWEEQVGLMVDVLEVDAIADAVREFREQAASAGG
jgi:hypothetical protein